MFLGSYRRILLNKRHIFQSNKDFLKCWKCNCTPIPIQCGYSDCKYQFNKVWMVFSEVWMVLKWFSTKSEWFSSTYWIVTQLLHLLIWTRTKPNSERKQFLTCLDSYLDFSYALKKENQSHESGIEASTDTLCTSRCSSNRHKNVSFCRHFAKQKIFFTKKQDSSIETTARSDHYFTIFRRPKRRSDRNSQCPAPPTRTPAIKAILYVLQYFCCKVHFCLSLLVSVAYTCSKLST